MEPAKDDLTNLCRLGQAFEVEAQLKNRGSIPSLPKKKQNQPTPLSVAIESGFHSLVVVLLRNGYPVNDEPSDPVCRAICRRRSDIVELLSNAGARISCRAIL